MKKIASSIFWVSMAIILLHIHLVFVYGENTIYEVYLSAYYVGMGIALVGITLAWMNMEHVISEIGGYKKYWINVLSIIKKWWYWVGFIFLFVLMYNVVNSITQLTMDEHTVSQKIRIGENPYMGQVAVVLTAMVMIAFMATALWRRMKKMPEVML